MDSLNSIQKFMDGNPPCSLARAVITWNCTHEAQLCDKRFVRRVVIPSSKFLALLGKSYDFTDGREAHEQLKIYASLMCGSKTEMVEAMTDASVENILNNTQYFHTARLLTSPWGQHAQWCCTCKECYKHGICEHTLMMSIFIDKVSIPDALDEPSQAHVAKEGKHQAQG